MLEKKKRKFPIMLLGVAVLIIVIVVNVVVWQGYSDKQTQAASLEHEVLQVNELIAKAAAPPSGLEEQLAAAQAELATALAVFPKNVDRNDVYDFIVSTADECHVMVIPLATDADLDGGAGKSYKILQYHGSVSGSLGNVCNFMNKLRSGRYPTLMITECTVQHALQEGAVNSINDITVQVSLNLQLYVTSVRGA